MRSRPLESLVEAKAVKAAKGEGWKAVKVLHRGWPDRAFVRNRRIIFVEFKRPDEEPRRQQVYRIKKLKQAGETVLVVDTWLGFTTRLNEAARDAP
jgi:hypothetical protein